MAAYSIVISLLQTLNQRNPEVCYSHTAEALDSVRSTAEYFQNVLENACKSRFDTEKIKSLEETIRVAVSYAEDVVEMKISQIIKGSSWTFGILQHQDLLPLVEKMDTTKKQVMEIVSHHADQVLELSGDSLFGTSFTRYPMLEDDIVQGLDDDLEIIINRLKGRPWDLDIVTISGMGGIGKTTLARKAYDHLPIREIWMMKNLRYIRLEVPSHLPSPRIGSLVTGMPNLQELSGLSFMSCSNEVFSGILNLKRLVIHLSHIPKGIPHHQLDMSRLTKLKAFKLYGAPYLRDPIKRFGFPTSLRRLSLSRCCHFDWADVSSTVMMLPNLEVLKLIFNETLSNEWSLSDEWRMSDKDVFKTLKLLLLSGTNFKHWEASSDNLPNLKRLVLKKCPHLQQIPADFGEICTLESIELHDCSVTAEDSAKNIEREQEDMGNKILKVCIVDNNNWAVEIIDLLMSSSKCRMF